MKINNFINWLSLIFIGAGVLVFGQQVFSWATKGEWFGLSILDSLFVFPMSCEPKSFCTWLLEPTSWYGIHGIADSIPASVLLIIFGVLIFYFRKNFIPTEPQEFVNKPWHRLLNIIFYGSTIAIALVVFFSVSFTSWNWENRQVTAYSFESGYEQAKGNEELCFFTKNYDYDSNYDRYIYYSPKIDCAGFYSSESVLKRYLDPTLFARMAGEIEMKADEIVNKAIENGEFDNVRVKVVTDFEFLSFLQYIFIGVIAGLFFATLWFIVLVSLVYRVALYVIYGR